MKHSLTTGPVARNSPLYRLIDRKGHIHPATTNWAVCCTLQRKLKGTVQVLCRSCGWAPADDNGECLSCNSGYEDEKAELRDEIEDHLGHNEHERLWWEDQFMSQA